MTEGMACNIRRFFRQTKAAHHGRIRVALPVVLLICTVSVLVVFPARAETTGSQSTKRGEYIYRLAGCKSCHTDSMDKELGPAGGVALDTPFGTFYTPNITPDQETGIGGWSDQQFIDAMRKGLSPDGEDYFPAFPYTSYTRMHDQDLLDLKAYLNALEPVSKVSKAHDLQFPYDQRWLMKFWKILFFQQQPFHPNSSRSESWNRGAYIVNGPGHCVECHTPRNLLGGIKYDELLAGNPEGPDGESMPSIDPVKSESFSQWSEVDIVFSLQTGMLPDGDFLGGSMGHVIENSTSLLTDRDLSSIAEYLQYPGIEKDKGIFYAIFGSADAVTEEKNMMGSGYGMMFGGVFMWLVWLLLIAGVVWMVLALLRGSRSVTHEKSAMGLMNARYAKGEIDRNEFEQQRKDLE